MIIYVKSAIMFCHKCNGLQATHSTFLDNS
jgi:hypothetical protein